MKHILFYILLLAGFAAGAQLDDPPPMRGLKMNIPGTKVFVTRPVGFDAASAFVGLQSETSAIQVFDLDGGSFYTNGATFSRAAFEEKGAKVFEYKEMTIDGYPAKYVFMQGNPEMAYAIEFGDTTFSVMMIGSFPADDDKTGAEIKDCLLSASYDKSLKVDPLATAPFKLDDSKSSLKFLKSVAGMYIYTKRGNTNSPESDPMMLVRVIPAEASMTPRDVADMMMENFKKYGLSDMEQKNSSMAKVNGYNAYETERYCVLHGEKNFVYQLVVIKGDKAVYIEGTTTKDFVRNLKEFKELAKTVHFK